MDKLKLNPITIIVFAVMQLTQIGFLCLLGVNMYFIKSELVQIKEDRGQIHVLREFMAATQASRFTTHDGAKLYQKIAELEVKIASLPDENPPEWFRNIVTELHRSMSQVQISVAKTSTEIQDIKRDIEELKNAT